MSKDNLKETIRLKKRDFFHKNRLKSSDNFTLKDLAFNAIRYLVENYRIKSEEELRACVDSAPFVKNYITKNDIEALIGLIKPPQSTILDPSDLGKSGKLS
ncbi:MAG: hypothetical protein ACTSPI_10570 [Candidatus Heimdallarchaeaceae archaeon]